MKANLVNNVLILVRTFEQILSNSINIKCK